MGANSTPIATLALLGWIPFVLALFCYFQPRRAVMISILGGMLFLPEASYLTFPIVSYSKWAAISIATLIGIAIFDFRRVSQYRFAWYDLIFLVFLTSPVLSSMLNDLGLKDGIVEATGTLLVWGAPYFIGRLYLTDYEALREVAIAVFIGGLIYVPLCLVEIQLSPQLHRWIYGKHQHDFQQTMRLGGYRPMVFMQHGLAVGSFMAAASVVGFTLWMGGSLRKVFGMPMAWSVAALVVVTVLCKSTGAIVLLMAGLGVVVLCMKGRTAIPLMVMIALPMLYVTARMTHVFDGRALVDTAKDFNEDRANSLKFRLDNEDPIIDRTLEKPFFGWAGWDRSRVMPNQTRWDGVTVERLAVLDGLWIITVGKRGIIGLVALFALFFVGPLLLNQRVSPRFWSNPMVAPAFAAAMFVVMHLIDCIPNAMPSAIAYFLSGGLAGLVPMRQLMEQAYAARLAAAQQAQFARQAYAPPVTPWPAPAGYASRERV